ncbi:hypothetical protein GpartN1_g179.t1 [Galdieria partita]|uniref:RNA exonuclease 4 n=1 Tax=Galdieria partita TaxID=83374 RepID=A0A9C7PPP3_9RHOD|nr:hypothetical protein GpartN1_g179.t1 [Galdieria partita]
MEQIIARVIHRQQSEEHSQDKLSKQIDSCEKPNSALLRKRKTSPKVSLKPDQNWLVIREKLASIGNHDEASYKHKRKRMLNSYRKQAQGETQSSSAFSREAAATSSNQHSELGNSKRTEEYFNSKEMPRLTKVVALDCEFVGVGKLGKEHSLARVSIVNFKGEVLYDKYVVNDKEPVVDYRTSVSGIRPEHLKSSEALPFERVQQDVYAIIRNRILVGHAIHHDMRALLLSHPRKLIRDTSKWRGLRSHLLRKTPSLRKLAQEILGIRIQEGEHDSVEDARATLMIYKRFAKEWEMELQTKNDKLVGKKHR